YAYSILTGEQPVSASEVYYKASRDTPRALSIEEIKLMVQYFTDGAKRAQEAGYDSVELSGATGYLISQFLSPFTNQRTDDYGGNFQNRMRFAQEIIQSIKTGLGQDYPVIFRLSFADYVKGGNTLKDSKKIVKELEKAGADAFDMQVGWHESRVPTIAMQVPRAAFAYLSREVKKEASVPIMVTNMINTPELANELVQNGTADLVCMGRPLIVDPELPNKAEQGRLKEIRLCIACNQGCFDGVLNGMAVNCMLNPAAGKEDAQAIIPAEKPKKIMVVGAGPGGIEAARTLTMRGHDVTLYEKEGILGGQLNLCHLPPGRKEFKRYIEYLVNEIERLNIKVETGVTVTADMVLEKTPDSVVLSTGSKRIMPPIPGIDLPHVFHAEEVLKGNADLGESVVVIGGGSVGCETAMYIADKGTMSPSTAFFLMENGVIDLEEALAYAKEGRSVTILEMLDRTGADFGRSYRWVIMQDLGKYNVKMMNKTECLEITEKEVIVSVDGTKETIAADTVVIATGYLSENELFTQLQGKVDELFQIGDANQPRKVMDAVHEGAKVGREI
ncbi:MAG: FAD-dependent oxidoreductase, partial [Desulfobacterales bacterium]|nr:FAD-dependent oxidoreductase [Desulfobacterales bacterium]